MTLPVVPGSSLSFSQINTELGYSSTATISLNDSAVRTLAGVGASPATIAITNLSGKSNTYSVTISSDQTNLNLRSYAVSAGWNQTTNLIATINSGIYVSANSTGTPGLTINGSFPAGVSLINNGYIIGMGGDGGNGGGSDVSNYYPGTPGGGGGGALSVSSAVSITNNGTIGGGGGGGGGAQTGYIPGAKYPPGGIGAGGGGGGASGRTNSAGGAGGVGIPTYVVGPGFGGSPGTVSGGGAGGGTRNGWGGPGGPGGGFGSSGSTGGTLTVGNKGVGPYPGGSGGYAVSGNANITWVATGTRLGSIS